MKRKFTIDLYSDTNSISFPFRIEYNAPDIDEVLYKIYCIVSTEIAKEITIQPENGWVTAKEAFFDCFDVYLNEELNNGDIIPIYSSSDEEIKRLLLDFDSIFINYDLTKASKMYLNELIEYIVIKVKNNVKLNKNQIEIHYISIECPKWFESGISYQDIKFTPFGVQNYQNLTTDICFRLDTTIHKNSGLCVTYWIAFSDFDFITSIYETKHEFSTYINQTLNNTYGVGNATKVPYTNSSNKKIFNAGPLPQVCISGTIQEINSFQAYSGDLYKPLIIPVDDYKPLIIPVDDEDNKKDE